MEGELSKIVQIVTRPGHMDGTGSWSPLLAVLTDDGRVLMYVDDEWLETPPIPVVSDRE